MLTTASIGVQPFVVMALTTFIAFDFLIKAFEFLHGLLLLSCVWHWTQEAARQLCFYFSSLESSMV
jgi:uncharacterized membrane protein YczE